MRRGLFYNQHTQMVQQLEGTEARGVAPFYKPAPLPTSPKLMDTSNGARCAGAALPWL